MEDELDFCHKLEEALLKITTDRWCKLGQDQVRLTENLHSSSPQIGVQLIVSGRIILIKM